MEINDKPTVVIVDDEEMVITSVRAFLQLETDYEIQGFPPTHGTSACLPAALALGEETRASGRDIILAYVLGWEVQGRLRVAGTGAAAAGGVRSPPGAGQHARGR